MSKRVVIRKVVNRTLALRILRTVDIHEGFWFYRAMGNFSGKKAASLRDFAKILRVVKIESVDFHFSRGDFRRWIQFILGDIDLCIRINRVPKNIRGEKLRSILIKIVEERIGELEKSK
ncbi:hypothetical protein E2P47_03105 [Candidatus Bathyarchaeota archaeon]|nr:hypothetical protein E2P47_03105 [Candidatus Bathyarchaeota archaeon]